MTHTETQSSTYSLSSVQVSCHDYCYCGHVPGRAVGLRRHRGYAWQDIEVFSLCILSNLNIYSSEAPRVASLTQGRRGSGKGKQPLGEFEEMTCHPGLGLSLSPNELISGRRAKGGGNAPATVALRGPQDLAFHLCQGRGGWGSGMRMSRHLRWGGLGWGHILLHSSKPRGRASHSEEAAPSAYPWVGFPRAGVCKGKSLFCSSAEF